MESKVFLATPGLGHNKRNNSRPIIARFVSYKKRNVFLTNKRNQKNMEDNLSLSVKIFTLKEQTAEAHAKILLIHLKWQCKR